MGQTVSNNVAETQLLTDSLKALTPAFTAVFTPAFTALFQRQAPRCSQRYYEWWA
jgi:hypothetical protein